MRRLTFRLVGPLALVIAGLSVASCALPPSLPSTPASPVDPSFNGAVLDPWVQLPELGLQRADGTHFTTADTRGRASIFFFGYTFCADVCPLTLANVAQVRRELGAQAAGINVYFVTVDPERDSAPRLLDYLSKFDSGFVGLTGTSAELEQARAAFGVVAQKQPLPNSASGYTVDHSAGLYLVDAESRIRVVEPYGMTPSEIAADVQRLLGAAQEAAPPTQLLVEGAWARAATATAGDQSATSAVYMTIRNPGMQADTLMNVRTDVAGSAEIHHSTVDQGVMRMQPVCLQAIPAGSTVTFEPGGLHIMLMGLRQDLPEGSQIKLELEFERAATMEVLVPVRSAAPTMSHHGG